MDKSTSSMEIDALMSSALVIWFASCLDPTEKKNLSYDDLVDGSLMYSVYLQINPHGQDDDVLPSRNDTAQRYRNLASIVEKLRQFYEADQGQLLLRTPNVEQLAREPESNVAEAKLLLCLLLGCAVQCQNNQKFIEGITELDELTKGDIRKYIQQVVYIPGIVLTSDMLTAIDECADQTFDKQIVFERLHRIYAERNELCEKSAARNNTFLNTSPFARLDRSMDFEGDQMDELKMKLREQRSKITKMDIDMAELRDAYKESEIEVEKLKVENVVLSTDMRTLCKNLKDCNDELDVAREEAQRANRLEQEILRYKEKLRDMDDCKAQVGELNQLNQLLMETKEELEKQVNTYALKADKVEKLEKRIFQLNQQVNDLMLEDAAWKEKWQALVQRNEQLERQLTELKKVSVTDSDDSSFSVASKSLCEQLTTIEHSLSSQKALELELENRRLSNALEALKESSVLQSSSKILDLEKEKKKLSLIIEALKDDLSKVQQLKGTEARESRLRLAELKKKVNILEEEKKNGLWEVEKQRKVVEASAAREVIGKLEKEMEESSAELDRLSGVVEKINSDNTDTVKMRKTSKKIDTLEKSEKHNQQQFKLIYKQVQKDYQTEFKDIETKLRIQSEYSRKLEEKIKNLRNNDGSRHSNVSEEYAKLKDNSGKLMPGSTVVMAQSNKLTTDYNYYKRKLDAKNAKITELELYNNVRKERCQMLLELNKQLTNEKKILMDGINEMVESCKELSLKSMEHGEQRLIGERENNEKFNKMKGLKERLEAKLLDQMIKSENPNKKKSCNIIKTTFSKVRRAGSELFSRGRRSWAEETSSASERSNDFEYHKGTESNASSDTRIRSPREFCVSDIEYNTPRNRKSVDFLENFCPDNFSFSNMKCSCEAKRRMSMGFHGCLRGFSWDNNNEGNEPDLALQKSANDIFSNKTVDLSFEENDAKDEIKNVKDNNNKI